MRQNFRERGSQNKLDHITCKPNKTNVRRRDNKCLTPQYRRRRFSEFIIIFSFYAWLIFSAHLPAVWSAVQLMHCDINRQDCIKQLPVHNNSGLLFKIGLWQSCWEEFMLWDCVVAYLDTVPNSVPEARWLWKIMDNNDIQAMFLNRKPSFKIRLAIKIWQTLTADCRKSWLSVVVNSYLL